MSSEPRDPIKPAEILSDNPYLQGLGRRVLGASAVLGLLGIAIAVIMGAAAGDGYKHFSFSYLTALMYFLSLSLGALFFVAVQHVSRASWSVVVRRLAEVAAAALPWLFILALPVIVPVVLGSSPLYPWLRPAAGEELAGGKAIYLTPLFFGLRMLVYFAVWTWLSLALLRRSSEQDGSGDPRLTRVQWKLSAPGLLLYALTLTFCAIDLVMSLQPAWFSTIFSVYYFSGCVVGFMAILPLSAMLLQRSGRLRQTITVEHYHDMGKLLFAFTFFWAYIAFSQYLLTWYANVPEETQWYQPRQHGAWLWVFAGGLLLGHFIIPFLGLIGRAIKRRKRLLAFWAVWMLAAHYVDIYWLVMPAYSPARVPASLLDAACFIGLGGLWLAGVTYLALGRALVPLRDPALPDSLRFENV